MKPVFLAALAAMVPCVCAQSNVDSTGLVSGYLFDEPSHSLRAIIGVPGSSYLGRAVMSGLDQAVPSPGGNWVVALRGGQTVIAGLANGNLTREWMPELLAAHTAAAWSADGKSAVLYDAGSKSLQRVAFGDTVTAAVPVPVDGEGPLAAMATDGSKTALVLGAEGSMRLVIVSGDNRQTILESARIGAVAASGPGRFHAVDEAAGMMIEAGEAAAPAWQLPEAAGALFASADGKYVYAAAKQSAKVLVYDTASRTLVREIATDLPAASLRALSRDTLLLLNARRQKGDTLFVLDTQNEPAVYFVPAGDE